MASTSLLPSKYRKSSDSAIASYSYTDIEEGTGIVSYYLAWSSTDPTTYSPILTHQTLYSAVIEDGSPNDYNLTAFNLPKTIKGTAHLSIGAYNTGGSALHVAAQLQKVSNGVVTNCSSRISGANVAPGGKKMCLIELPLTQTHFKKGDILRVSIKTSGMTIGTDPQSRTGTMTDGSTTITKSTLFLPFKLNP